MRRLSVPGTGYTKYTEMIEEAASRTPGMRFSFFGAGGGSWNQKPKKLSVPGTGYTKYTDHRFQELDTQNTQN
jgi:hypothetical protein